MDIGFDCLGNALGIGEYLGREDQLLPVCANFWNLPFADKSMDVVCTFCGLDESRENDKTISETARVLKTGGKFICVSRENAFMRQKSILEPFGFTKEETIDWLRRCRMYSDVNTLVESCRQKGLQFTAKESSILSHDITYVILQFIKQD